MTLINPTVADAVRNFQLQNASNLDEIDAEVGLLTVQNYLPTLTAATNPNLGSTGVIAGVFYSILGWVTTWGYFKFSGTGISSGDSTYIVSLPFTVDTNFRSVSESGSGFQVGSGILYDDSNNNNLQTVAVQLRDPTSIQFNLEAEVSASTRAVSGSSGGIPFNFATGDRIHWQARFKKAV